MGHDVPQLGCADVTVPVPIKDLEGLLDLLFAISVGHLPGHHGQELGEIDGAASIGVDLVDHVLEFGLCGVLTHGTHDSAKLLCSDLAVPIYHHGIMYRLRGGDGSSRIVEWSLTFIEQRESLLKL